MSAITKAASAAASRAVGRALNKARHGARRGVSKAAKAAREDSDIIGAGIGGVALGFMRANGTLDRLPTFGLSPEMGAAAIAYGAHKFMPGNKYAKTAAVAAVAIAGYHQGQTWGAPGGGGGGVRGERHDEELVQF